MDSRQPPAIRGRLLGRRTSRRTLLAGSAAVAAAGTTAAVLGLEYAGSGGGVGPVVAAEAPGKANISLPATIDLRAPIADARTRAAHLLRRAGFGGTAEEIDEFAQLSREEAADRLLDFAGVDNSALEGRLAKAGLVLGDAAGDARGPARLITDMQRRWLMRMAYTARPLEERMTLIWHGLLTSQVSKIGPLRARLMVTQNELFRHMALARYDDLVKAVSKDPAMLIYLDTVESAKEHPNENYARELMELFTMGVGNYTEQDVRESARAFTGWRITPPERPKVDPNTLTPEEKRKLQQEVFANYRPTFVMAQRQHDGGQKAFLGQTGAFNGDDIVDIIMRQPATGRFVTRRLFSELANDSPEPATLDRLVAVWDDSGHDVRAVVRAILTSDEFYSQASYRAFVRSPVEFAVHAVRALEIETDFRFYPRYGPLMEQVLFEPPSVAGWPGGAAWLSSSTFFARLNYVDAFLSAAGRGRATAIPALSRASTPTAAIDRALATLVDDDVSVGARQALYEYASRLPAGEQAAGIAYLVLASPEYQLI
ncbi:MAG: DUF1800 domain-containing protein [Dehalococcoidia bacterium]|nr:DUF1800 domain-containing protein [Dehalococcoidia bacterium]